MAKKQPAKRKNFYLGALDDLERIELKNAATVEGIDDEIDFMRVRLKQLVKMKPPNNDDLIKCYNALCRALVTKYTIEGKNKKSIKESINSVVQDLLIPAGINLGTTVISKNF